MGIRRRGTSFATLILLLAAAPAWAQATAQLTGSVRDESGAVLSGRGSTMRRCASWRRTGWRRAFSMRARARGELRPHSDAGGKPARPAVRDQIWLLTQVS